MKVNESNDKLNSEFNGEQQLNNLEIKEVIPTNFGRTKTYSHQKNIASLEQSDRDELLLIRKEVAMWRAVIMQALLDCVNMSKRTEDKVAKNQALRWFSMQNENFLMVCEFAHLDPSQVLRKANKAIKNDCKWRNDVMKKRRQDKTKSTIIQLELERKSV